MLMYLLLSFLNQFFNVQSYQFLIENDETELPVERFVEK